MLSGRFCSVRAGLDCAGLGGVGWKFWVQSVPWAACALKRGGRIIVDAGALTYIVGISLPPRPTFRRLAVRGEGTGGGGGVEGGIRGSWVLRSGDTCRPFAPFVPLLTPALLFVARHPFLALSLLTAGLHSASRQGLGPESAVVHRGVQRHVRLQQVRKSGVCGLSAFRVSLCTSARGSGTSALSGPRA